MQDDNQNNSLSLSIRFLKKLRKLLRFRVSSVATYLGLSQLFSAETPKAHYIHELLKSSKLQLSQYLLINVTVKGEEATKAYYTILLCLLDLSSKGKKAALDGLRDFATDSQILFEKEDIQLITSSLFFLTDLRDTLSDPSTTLNDILRNQIRLEIVKDVLNGTSQALRTSFNEVLALASSKLATAWLLILLKSYKLLNKSAGKTKKRKAEGQQGLEYSQKNLSQSASKIRQTYRQARNIFSGGLEQSKDTKVKAQILLCMKLADCKMLSLAEDPDKKLFFIFETEIFWKEAEINYGELQQSIVDIGKQELNKNVHFLSTETASKRDLFQEKITEEKNSLPAGMIFIIADLLGVHASETSVILKIKAFLKQQQREIDDDNGGLPSRLSIFDIEERALMFAQSDQAKMNPVEKYVNQLSLAQILETTGQTDQLVRVQEQTEGEDGKVRAIKLSEKDQFGKHVDKWIFKNYIATTIPAGIASKTQNTPKSFSEATKNFDKEFLGSKKDYNQCFKESARTSFREEADQSVQNKTFKRNIQTSEIAAKPSAKGISKNDSIYQAYYVSPRISDKNYYFKTDQSSLQSQSFKTPSTTIQSSGRSSRAISFTTKNDKLNFQPAINSHYSRKSKYEQSNSISLNQNSKSPVRWSVFLSSRPSSQESRESRNLSSQQSISSESVNAQIPQSQPSSQNIYHFIDNKLTTIQTPSFDQFLLSPKKGKGHASFLISPSLLPREEYFEDKKNQHFLKKLAEKQSKKKSQILQPAKGEINVSKEAIIKKQNSIEQSLSTESEVDQIIESNNTKIQTEKKIIASSPFPSARQILRRQLTVKEILSESQESRKRYPLLKLQSGFAGSGNLINFGTESSIGIDLRRAQSQQVEKTNKHGSDSSNSSSFEDSFSGYTKRKQEQENEDDLNEFADIQREMSSSSLHKTLSMESPHITRLKQEENFSLMSEDIMERQSSSNSNSTPRFLGTSASTIKPSKFKTAQNKIRLIQSSNTVALPTITQHAEMNSPLQEELMQEYSLKKSESIGGDVLPKHKILKKAKQLLKKRQVPTETEAELEKVSSESTITESIPQDKDKILNLVVVFKQVKKLKKKQERTNLEKRCKQLILQCIASIKAIHQAPQVHKLKKNLMNFPFQFMARIPGTHPVLVNVTVDCTHERFYQMSLKWEYQCKLIEFDADAIINSMTFEYETVQAVCCIGMFRKLIDRGILSNVDSYGFETYLENQQFNLKPLQELCPALSFITFEDAVLLANLQNIIQYYFTTSIYFQYELSGHRYYEKLNNEIGETSMVHFESLNAAISNIIRKRASIMDFNEIDPTESQELTNSNLSGSSKQQQQKLVELFEKHTAILNPILASLSKPKHVLGYLIKQGNTFSIVQLKICFFQELTAVDILQNNFDLAKISFLIKSSNFSEPDVQIQAIEVTAKDLFPYFKQYDFLMALRHFILRSRFPRIWRRILISVFQQAVSFTVQKNETKEIVKGIKKISTIQTIIFSKFRNDLQRARAEPIWSSPTIQNGMEDEKTKENGLHQLNKLEGLFQKRFNEIYEMNFIQKREKDADDGMTSLATRIIEMQGKLPQVQNQNNELFLFDLLGDENDKNKNDKGSQKMINLNSSFDNNKPNAAYVLKSNATEQINHNIAADIDVLHLQRKSFILSENCVIISFKQGIANQTSSPQLVILLRDGIRRCTQQIPVDNGNRINLLLQIFKLKLKHMRTWALSRMVIVQKNLAGKIASIQEATAKGELLNLQMKDDDSIKRHVIIRTNLLQKFFEVINRTYILKSSECGRCSVSIELYLLKKKAQRTGQLALLSVSIFPNNTRIKQLKGFLGFQDLQEICYSFCVSLLNAQEHISEQAIENLASSIFQRIILFRSFFGTCLNFRQYDRFKDQQLFEKNSLIRKSSTNSIASLYSQRKYGSNGDDDSRPESSLLISRMRGKNEFGMKRKKGFLGVAKAEDFKGRIDSVESESQKKIIDRIDRLKGWRNKSQKYSFMENEGVEDRELSNPFLENCVHHRRVVFQMTKLFYNQYTLVSVLRDTLLGTFYLQIYIPKVARVLETSIEIPRLQDCSIEFLANILPDKLFFFADNSRLDSIFQSYSSFQERLDFFKKNPVSTPSQLSSKRSTGFQRDSSIIDNNNVVSQTSISPRIIVSQPYEAADTLRDELLQRKWNSISSSKDDSLPLGKRLKRTSQEPIFSNFMIDLLPKPEIITNTLEGIWNTRERVTRLYQQVLNTDDEILDRLPVRQEKPRRVTFVPAGSSPQSQHQKHQSQFYPSPTFKTMKTADFKTYHITTSRPPKIEQNYLQQPLKSPIKLSSTRINILASQIKRPNMTNRWRDLVFKHWIRLIYSKNTKQLFDVFRSKNAKKVDKVYQFAAFVDHVDAFYINRVQQERLKKLYVFIEAQIWEKIIKDYLDIKAKPQDEGQLNYQNKRFRNGTFSLFAVIDGTAQFHLKELLYSDFLQIDNNEFHTSIFANFFEEMQSKSEDLDISEGSIEYFFFERLPRISYIDIWNHILEVHHLKMRELASQRIYLNLSEIVNLSIAEGTFKSRLNYADSILSSSEFRQLSHYVMFKIKTHEFLDILETTVSSRTTYTATRELDSLQSIQLFAEINVPRKSIEFQVSKTNINCNSSSVSRTVPTFFFEPYIPALPSLLQEEQYSTALDLIMKFYGSKMLLHFYNYKLN